MENRTMRQMNIETYGNVCMAGYTLARNNPLTLHHIIFLSQGGKSILENTANASTLAHCGVHILSEDDKRKEREIIEYFFDYREHPDILAAKQFAAWLRREMYDLDYEAYVTKNRTLMYKRRY